MLCNVDVVWFPCFVSSLTPIGKFWLFFSVVIPMPSGNTFTVVHISHNGSDTKNCGDSADSACFSLQHVVHSYYGQPPKRGLALSTDKSLLIDDDVMVSCCLQKTYYQYRPNSNRNILNGMLCHLQRKCQSFRSSRFLCTSKESGLNISITVTDTYFNQSLWASEGVNFNFVNSNMKLLRFYFYGVNPMEEKKLQIRQSRLGQLDIEYATAVVVNCSCFQTNIPRNEAFVTVKSSTVFFTSLHTELYSGGSFLQAIPGIIHFTNVTFIKTISEDCLIQVWNKSSIEVNSCAFISNAFFQHKGITWNSSMVEHGLIKSVGSSVLVTNCLFSENAFPLG